MLRNQYQSLTRIQKTLCWLSLIVLSGFIPSAAHASKPEQVLAAQVPGGAVRVLVLIMDKRWPWGGLRIEDDKGTILVPLVEPDRQALSSLDAVSQRALESLKQPPAMSEAHVKAANAILALRLVSDWTFARAAGMGVELPMGLHPRMIKVLLLNANGDLVTTIGPVSVRNDAGPPAPLELHAQATPQGISLGWRTAPHADAVPAYAYSVQRDSGTEHDTLTPHARLLTIDKSGRAIPYVDHAAPVGAVLNYQLRLVDILGVPSKPDSVQIYSPDFEAAIPPTHQTAKAGRGIVTLTWTPVSNPRTRGLVVERAQLIKGPYELLTPEGLSPQTSQYEDHHVMPGAVYYYRVRAEMPNGEVGPATDPAIAQPLSATALSAPQGLKANVGISQVALTWSPVPGVSVAGYIVERRAASSAPRWTRLNTRLAPSARYIDMIGPSQGGIFEYRVTAVATDEGLSPPSTLLRVQLKDTVPPGPPIVLSASGADGRVRIHFTPAGPAAKTVQVVLLRSDSSQEEGLVVGAPVPVATGIIRDDWVHGGQAYWYRLVAFDKEGNRSLEGQAFEVRVGAISLPTPRAPSVHYAAQPVPEIKLAFDAPPPHVRVIVEVQRDDGRWQRVAGPLDGTSAVDLNPPGPHASYRIVYVGEDGGAGRPSPSAASQ